MFGPKNMICLMKEAKSKATHTINILLHRERREFLKNVCLYMQKVKPTKTYE